MEGSDLISQIAAQNKIHSSAIGKDLCPKFEVQIEAIPHLKFSPNFPSSLIPVSSSWDSYHSWVEGSSLLNKIKLPMRGPERNWQRAATFSALMQLKTPSEKKIKGYPRQRRCISELSVIG
jgi:hypothetical protein